jgi:hypothetical protein
MPPHMRRSGGVAGRLVGCMGMGSDQYDDDRLHRPVLRPPMGQEESQRTAVSDPQENRLIRQPPAQDGDALDRQS